MRKVMSGIEITYDNISMESGLERLALESNVLSNLLQVFKNLIPTFANGINEANVAVKGILTDNNLTKEKISGKHHDVLNRIKSIDFINFGETIINVPEGFTGDLLSYSRELTTITKEIYAINNTMLVEYNTILSSFLSNKDDKVSLKDHTVFFNRVQKQREDIVKQLSKYTKDSEVSKVRLITVLKRFSDLEPLIFSSIELSKLQNKNVITGINSSVNQSTELLDLIITRIKDGNIDNISSTASMNIAKGAYEIAKLVQMVGILYYDTEVLLNTVNGILDEILKKSK